MTELFAYRIPDKYLYPHKVVVPFIARVVFEVDEGDVKILEVGLSESAVKFVRTGEQFMNELRATIEAKIKPVSNNKHVSETVMSAIAPHI
jgi:bifunctional DNA-binding transcriptional regulator/antitoxin component of YhaV-PrlF toxin-antitoxin module